MRWVVCIKSSCFHILVISEIWPWKEFCSTIYIVYFLNKYGMTAQLLCKVLGQTKYSVASHVAKTRMDIHICKSFVVKNDCLMASVCGLLASGISLFVGLKIEEELPLRKEGKLSFMCLSACQV